MRFLYSPFSKPYYINIAYFLWTNLAFWYIIVVTRYIFIYFRLRYFLHIHRILNILYFYIGKKLLLTFLAWLAVSFCNSVFSLFCYWTWGGYCQMWSVGNKKKLYWNFRSRFWTFLKCPFYTLGQEKFSARHATAPTSLHRMKHISQYFFSNLCRGLFLKK